VINCEDLSPFIVFGITQEVCALVMLVTIFSQRLYNSTSIFQFISGSALYFHSEEVIKGVRLEKLERQRVVKSRRHRVEEEECALGGIW